MSRSTPASISTARSTRGASTRPTRCRSATAWHLTLSGRYNQTSIRNRDRIEPGGGPGSLDGDHVVPPLQSGRRRDVQPVARAQRLRRLQRRQPRRHVDRARLRRSGGAVQAAQRDGRRPAARTGRDAERWKAAARGQYRGVSWNAGVFRAANRDDILFVTSEQTGFGYFRNFGETRRAGNRARRATAELGASRVGAGYTYLDATFQSEETVNGESNSSNDAAEDGEPGLEGTIEIEPGDRMPLIPAHMLKAYADVAGHVAAVTGPESRSPSRARTRAATRTTGTSRTATYYLGPGTAPGYAIVNLGGPLSVHAVAPGRRADQQPVRSPLLHRRAARAHWASPTPAPSSRGRFLPSTASFRSGTERSSRPARRSGRGSGRASRSEHPRHLLTGA